MSKVEIEHGIVSIFGLSLFSSSKRELLGILQTHLTKQNEPLFIFTPNAEQIVLSLENPNFRRNLQQADILIPDGFSLVIASFLLSLLGKSSKISQKIAGVDLAQNLIKITEQNNQDILILGGKDYQLLLDSSSQVNKSFNLWKLDKNLYWTPAYGDFSNSSKEERATLVNNIKNLKPAVVMVALGAPNQEKWSLDNQQLLSESGVKLVMVVGGAFDIIFGRLRRAPKIMRVFGLEWLFRLIQEPWRWKRQLGLLKFWYYLVLKR